MCYCEKKTYVNKECNLLNTYLLMFLLPVPFNKLPCQCLHLLCHNFYISYEIKSTRMYVCIFTIFLGHCELARVDSNYQKNCNIHQNKEQDNFYICRASSQNNTRYEQLNFIKISRSVPKRLKIKEFPPNYLPHTT